MPPTQDLAVTLILGKPVGKLPHDINPPIEKKKRKRKIGFLRGNPIRNPLKEETLGRVSGSLHVCQDLGDPLGPRRAIGRPPATGGSPVGALDQVAQLRVVSCLKRALVASAEGFDLQRNTLKGSHRRGPALVLRILRTHGARNPDDEILCLGQGKPVGEMLPDGNPEILGHVLRDLVYAVGDPRSRLGLFLAVKNPLKLGSKKRRQRIDIRRRGLAGVGLIHVLGHFRSLSSLT